MHEFKNMPSTANCWHTAQRNAYVPALTLTPAGSFKLATTIA